MTVLIISLTHSLSSISDRIQLIEKESTIIVPVFCPKISTVDGCKVATASIFLPEQFCVRYLPHIAEGGRKVVISFPRNESNYEALFLSTVHSTGALKQMWTGYIHEQREIAVTKSDDITYGAEKIVFRIPFKAKEEFYPGLFPPSEKVGEEGVGEHGIGCTNMESLDGSSNGIVMTFGVIEKPSLAHKIRSPTAIMPRKKKVLDMQNAAMHANQAAYRAEVQRQQNLRDLAFIEQRERELQAAQRQHEADLRRAQHAGTAGTVRAHEEINDVGNVQMNDDDDDSV